MLVSLRAPPLICPLLPLLLLLLPFLLRQVFRILYLRRSLISRMLLLLTRRVLRQRHLQYG